MSIQTTVHLKGTVFGKPQSCLFVQDAGPAELFRGRTPRELFVQSISNAGNPEVGEVEVLINVQRNCSFGITGFETNDLNRALEEARILEQKDERELLLEQFPEPEELLALTMKALIEEDQEAAEALADAFEAFAKNIIGPEAGEGAGEALIAAASTVVSKIRGKM